MHQPRVSSPLACHVILATDIEYDPYAPSRSDAPTSQPHDKPHTERDGNNTVRGSLRLDLEASLPPEEASSAALDTPSGQLVKYSAFMSKTSPEEANIDPQPTTPEFRSWPTAKQASPAVSARDQPVRTSAQVLADAREELKNGSDFARYDDRIDEPYSAKLGRYGRDRHAKTKATGRLENISASDAQAMPHEERVDVHNVDGYVLIVTRKRRAEADVAGDGEGDSKAEVVDARRWKKYRTVGSASEEGGEEGATADLEWGGFGIG
ncbi:hypothetical protein B0A55_07044 [Friedmanniomyces simplex]|uniref:Uncharacterized protein n=1 Tax=Friedmanniomyces simplex TaxID=329884 RepID=A0A4U0XBA5_9PEZI|nr:hypothetical protein B0A55_07044 [Friedmanniomyces simplex]